MIRARIKGFTLVEMVTTLTMLAIMAAIAAPFLSRGAEAYNASAASLQTLGKLRNASERLVREIREIRRDPSSGDYDVTVGANPLVFTKQDGETVSVNTSVPLVTLSYTSVTGVTPTLTDEVSSLTFRYLRSDGSTDATGGDNVAFIEFDLQLDPGSGGSPYAHRSRVALRNQQ
jgi:prepilin-type N-terminal cleavage/methylation domain-containing protein